MTARRATWFGAAALLLWAFLAPLARLAQGNDAPLPPLLLTGLGFAVGGGLALLLVAARGQLALLRQPALAWAHGVGGLAGFHALYFASLALAPPVEANLLNYLWPLLIVLLAAPILGLPLGPWRLAGVAMGGAGAALLLGAGAAFPASAALGFGCALLSALTWALYSVTSRRMAAVPTAAVAGFCLASAALALAAHVAFEATPAGFTAMQAVAVLLLGLGPMGAAFFLWDIGMKQGDPRLLGTLAYATPVASTLLLGAMGEGVLGWRALAAAALVAGGGLVASRAKG